MPSILSRLDLTGTGSCGSFNFRRTARAVTRLYDEALRESGIRSTQFAILIAIAKSQPVSIGAVADWVLIDRTTLTRNLRVLQKEGLITISSRSLMRRRFLKLARKGERVLAVCLPLWNKGHEQFVATVGSNYWASLQRELVRVAQKTSGLDLLAGKRPR